MLQIHLPAFVGLNIQKEKTYNHKKESLQSKMLPTCSAQFPQQSSCFIISYQWHNLLSIQWISQPTHSTEYSILIEVKNLTGVNQHHKMSHTQNQSFIQNYSS